VGPCYADPVEGGGWVVEDFSGGRHRYPPAERGR